MSETQRVHFNPNQANVSLTDGIPEFFILFRNRWLCSLFLPPPFILFHWLFIFLSWALITSKGGGEPRCFHLKMYSHLQLRTVSLHYNPSQFYPQIYLPPHALSFLFLFCYPVWKCLIFHGDGEEGRKAFSFSKGDNVISKISSFLSLQSCLHFIGHISF